MPEFVRVATVDEIPVGEMKAFEIRHNRLAVCHTEDGFHAIADECSHDSAPIGAGRLEGNEIVCPRHGARFDIRSGEVTAVPAVVGIDTFETKVENNQIYVRLD